MTNFVKFYAFSTLLSSDTSISAFTVTVTYSDSSVVTYDNNGNKFPVQDSIMFQPAQSCLTGKGGTNLTVSAAVSLNSLHHTSDRTHNVLGSKHHLLYAMSRPDSSSTDKLHYSHFAASQCYNDASLSGWPICDIYSNI